LKTTVITLLRMGILLSCVCQAYGSSEASPGSVGHDVELSQVELAAERPVPRRTDATRTRTPATQPERPARPPEAASPLPPPVLNVRPAAPPSEPVSPAPATRAGAGASATQSLPEKEEEGSLVMVPSQGRPVMLAPGDTFFFVMRLRRALGRQVLCWLVHSQIPEVRYPLQVDVELRIVQGRYGQMILQVPEKVTPGLYDLQVQGEGRSYFSRQSVKVVDQWRDKFRMVHLSNMNIDDPAAPEFDRMLVGELNLLAPDFIVCTGDFTQWGRALGDPNDWTRVLEFLGQIHAPAYIVCGDHDDEQSFDRYVADNPIGTFDYGNYHGILMLDHSAHRLDNEQIKWLKNELTTHRNLRGFNFVVMHSDELDVVDLLRRQVDDLPRFVKEHKLRMIIAGGHIDWDMQEFAAKVRGLDGPDGLIYVRTHESSTCMQDRATGISHYRVMQVDGQKVDYVYPDDNATTAAEHSIPVGRLRVFYSRPNDGTQDQVVATVQNALNQGFENCRVWLRVAKDGRENPAIIGGELVRVYDAKTHWVCEVRVDLPDKGSVKVMAASRGAMLPPPIPVTVSLVPEGTTRPSTTASASTPTLVFTQHRAENGLGFYRCQQRLMLVLANPTSVAQEVWPVGRLNGDDIFLDTATADRKPLVIEPGRQVTVPLKLVLGRLSPGPHHLQVFFLSDPLKRLSLFPVVLKSGGP
jgi:hypothetical protein